MICQLTTVSIASCRPARSDQPGQYVLYELYRAGTDTHTLAPWLFPVWPTQVRDAEQLLFGVRDVAALPGGNIHLRKRTIASSFPHRLMTFFSSSTQAIDRRTSPSDFSIWCGLMLVTWLDMSSRMLTSFSSQPWMSCTDTAKVGHRNTRAQSNKSQSTSFLCISCNITILNFFISKWNCWSLTSVTTLLRFEFYLLQNK